MLVWGANNKLVKVAHELIFVCVDVGARKNNDLLSGSGTFDVSDDEVLVWGADNKLVDVVHELIFVCVDDGVRKDNDL